MFLSKNCEKILRQFKITRQAANRAYSNSQTIAKEQSISASVMSLGVPSDRKSWSGRRLSRSGSTRKRILKPQHQWSKGLRKPQDLRKSSALNKRH